MLSKFHPGRFEMTSGALKREATGKTRTPSALITPEPFIISFSRCRASPFFFLLLLHTQDRMCVMRLAASVTTCSTALSN